MQFFIRPEGSEVRFTTGTHRNYFSVLLVDFFSVPWEFFGSSKTYLDLLRAICNTPLLSTTITPLGSTLDDFTQWLSDEVTIRKRWFPSIDLAIDLKIKRRDFVTICGNICKHNYTQLTRQATKFRRILQANDVHVDIGNCMIALPDFHEQFHDDILLYHATTIAQYLNDIRWGIFEYANEKRRQCVVTWWDDGLRIERYRYEYPSDIKSELGKHYFWELMNVVRREPYIPRFEVAD